MKSSPCSTETRRFIHPARQTLACLLTGALSSFVTPIASAQSTSSVDFAAPVSIGWAAYNTSIADADRDGDFDSLFTPIQGGLTFAYQASPGNFGYRRVGDGFGLLVDVTGDGYPDVVDVNGSDVRISQNDGFANFSVIQSIPTSAFSPTISPQRSAAGDVDGDGDIDLMITSYRLNQRYILLLNDGTGHFTIGWQSYAIPGEQSNDVQFADLDHDGDLDFISVGGVRLANIWINNGDQTFSPGYAMNGSIAVWNQGYHQGSVSVADINGDGLLDLLCPEASSTGNPAEPSAIVWYENTGDLTNFIRHVATSNQARTSFDSAATVPYWNAAAGDLDGDGDIDFVTSGDNTPSDAYLNDGHGNFTLGWQSLQYVQSPHLVPAIRHNFLVDTNGDGKLEYFGYGSYGAVSFGENLVEPSVPCTQVVEDLMAEIADLDAMLALASDNVTSLNQQIATAQAENESLRSSLSEAHATITTQANTIASKGSEIDHLTGELAAANTSIERLNLQVQSLNNSYISLKASHKDALAQLASANTKITELNQTIDNQNAAYAKLKAALYAEIDQLQSTLDAANASISERDATIADQTVTIASQSDSIAIQQATITSHETTMAEQTGVIAAQGVTIAGLNDTVHTLSDNAQAVADAIAAIETGLANRIAPGFVIPGDTADEKLANLAEALTHLEKGERQKLIRDLSGKHHGKSGKKSAKSQKDGKGK